MRGEENEEKLTIENKFRLRDLKAEKKITTKKTSIISTKKTHDNETLEQ